MVTEQPYLGITFNSIVSIVSNTIITPHFNPHRITSIVVKMLIKPEINKLFHEDPYDNQFESSAIQAVDKMKAALKLLFLFCYFYFHIL